MGKIVLTILVGALGVYFTSEANKSFKETKRPFVAPPAYVEHFHFGYNEPMADIFWIRLLQDLGACKTSGEEQDLPGDGKSACHLGWTYRMADAVTTLSPKLKMAYDASAMLLSVVGGDPEGSRLIFEKAVKQFPNDWSLHYRAAYHYLIEVKDQTRAAELLEKAGRLGAPDWVFSLAARLYGREGKIELARKVLTDYLKEFPEGRGAERAKQRLKEIDQGLVGEYEVRDKEATPTPPPNAPKDSAPNPK